MYRTLKPLSFNLSIKYAIHEAWSYFGTPIINQPQVGILALGAIRKVPAVIETPDGDFIGIRQKMFLSHSYDHRVVDGASGAQFLQTLKAILEEPLLLLK
jgi:2-oxoglutarate dehydrogenase E2 component (dihydrolipoamide succinyltransferase)